MPTVSTESSHTAFQRIHENIENLSDRITARDSDIIFLESLMKSPVLNSLLKVRDQLQYGCESIQPIDTNSIKLLQDVRKLCQNNSSKDFKELVRILENPHLEAVLVAHDLVATEKCYSTSPKFATSTVHTLQNRSNTEIIKMVVLNKIGDEPLGITIRTEEDCLIIARILAGGIVDRLGLLNVGDAILEINGTEVHTLDDLQQELQKSVGKVIFKICPSRVNIFPLGQTYIKALHAYDPSKDSLLPCKEIGLAFKQGDILQILSQDDPNWWQARKVNSLGHAGLIPSQELEEKRCAFVRPEFDHATKSIMCGARIIKKKKKTMYQIRSNAEFDKAELLVYEEVTKMPPFERKILILLGAEGIGKSMLKDQLIKDYPFKFGIPLAHTSRPIKESEKDGKNYSFVTREEMEEDIAENNYLEYGEYNGNLYGTKLESVRNIIQSGKICVLDCNPQALKILKTSEFMPFIVFIAAPKLDLLKHVYDYRHAYGSRNLTFNRAISKDVTRHNRLLESVTTLCEEEHLIKALEESANLQRAFEKYFDLVLVNENFNETYEQLKEAIIALSTEPQWVPLSWIY